MVEPVPKLPEGAPSGRIGGSDVGDESADQGVGHVGPEGIAAEVVFGSEERGQHLGVGVAVGAGQGQQVERIEAIALACGQPAGIEENDSVSHVAAAPGGDAAQLGFQIDGDDRAGIGEQVRDEGASAFAGAGHAAGQERGIALVEDGRVIGRQHQV